MSETTTKQVPPLDDIKDNSTQEDFRMKNKVYELLLYAGPQLEEFPRAKRTLAQKIKLFGNKPLIEDLPCRSGVPASTTPPMVALAR